MDLRGGSPPPFPPLTPTYAEEVYVYSHKQREIMSFLISLFARIKNKNCGAEKAGYRKYVGKIWKKENSIFMAYPILNQMNRDVATSLSYSYNSSTKKQSTRIGKWKTFAIKNYTPLRFNWKEQLTTSWRNLKLFFFFCPPGIDCASHQAAQGAKWKVDKLGQTWKIHLFVSLLRILTFLFEYFGEREGEEIVQNLREGGNCTWCGYWNKTKPLFASLKIVDCIPCLKFDYMI